MATVEEDAAERGYRRLSSLFRPPPGSSQTCQRCKRTVYQYERVGPVNDVVFHKQCFTCAKCRGVLTFKNYWANQAEPSDKEVYCQNHAPRIGGTSLDDQAVDIKRAQRASGLVRLPQRTNTSSELHSKPHLDNDALLIKGPVDAQLLQRRYQRKLDKHHYPPHIAKKREALFDAQKKLEEQLRHEEDAMFRAFQEERAHASVQIEEELNKEWEERLKELTERFDREMEKKKKKASPNDRKMMTVAFDKEKQDLAKTMTTKREKQKKTMTLRLREKEQRKTAELVTKHSQQMLGLLAAKQQELVQQLEQELALETQLYHAEQAHARTTENGQGEVAELRDALEVLAISATSPPSPHPPSCRKRDLYSDPSVFNDIDEQVIRVAESDQITYTDLVRQLTEGLVSDLEKARAIYRWITVKDLNVMEFDDNMEADTPMGLLRGIKYGTETYHVLFMRLCSYAGLHCMEIRGHSKSVGYEPGMKITPDTFQNTWNAVLIDGDWRLVQCNWGARHLVLNKDKGAERERDKSKRRDQIRYQYDEHYFLTDADEFIMEFWPLEAAWQLLESPITLEEFEALPFVRSVFFHYGMRFDGPRLAVLNTDDKGGVKVSLKIPEELENDLVFFYQLRFADRERKAETSYRSAALERFVFQTMVDNTVTFSVHVPTPADYFFEIFANRLEDGNRLLEDSSGAAAPFRLKCACKFRVHCASMTGKMHPLPACAAGEWGPKKAVRHFGLIPLLPPQGEGGEENQDTLKAGILTVEDRFEVRFTIPRPLQFVAKLRMNQVEDSVLDPFVILRSDDKNVVVSATLPQPGQYGLDLYARVKGNSDSNTLSHACKYLVNCTRVAAPVDIPRLPPPAQPVAKWGPTPAFESLGLRQLSHREPKIRVSESNSVTLDLHVPAGVTLSFQFLREPDEDNREYVTMTREDRASMVRFSITLPRPGNYMLSLYGRREDSEDRALANVCNYLVQMQYPVSQGSRKSSKKAYTPAHDNNNSSKPAEKSGSLFKKGLFKKAKKDSDSQSDRYSDKSSDRSDK